MNKEIINNIVAIVNDYYTKNFKRVKVSRKIIYSYNYLTKNPEEYIKNLKDYEYFTTKIKRRFYHNYFIRMEYKKINAEDKLL